MLACLLAPGLAIVAMMVPAMSPLATAAPVPSPVTAGEQLFVDLGCPSCHKSEGSGMGPKLAGLAGHPVRLEDGTALVADDAYIRESILDPQAKLVEGFPPIMPSFRGVLAEEQLLQLIAYIKSLAK